MTDFVGYFDAAGKRHDPLVMYVAGAVATADQWNRMGIEWELLLDDHGMPPVFHTTDYVRTQYPEYKHLRQRDDLRDAFENDVVETMRDYAVQPFATGLVLPDYRDLQQTFVLPPHLSTPFSFLATQVSLMVNGWAIRSLQPADTLAMVFEAGDDDRQGFVDWYDEHYHVVPNFHTKQQSKPLQIADIVAWRMAALMKHQQEFGTLANSPHRREIFVGIFDRLSMEHCGYGDKTTLHSHCDKLGIPRR